MPLSTRNLVDELFWNVICANAHPATNGIIRILNSILQSCLDVERSKMRTENIFSVIDFTFGTFLTPTLFPKRKNVFVTGRMND